GCPTMAAATSPARHAASLATSASIREPRQSKVHRAMEWPKPSSVRSSVTMSPSVRARMQTPSCTSYQPGLITTTRFTRTRHSDIVHPVSSSQLAEARDRVRSVGGYNKGRPLAYSSWKMATSGTCAHDEPRIEAPQPPIRGHLDFDSHSQKKAEPQPSRSQPITTTRVGSRSIPWTTPYEPLRRN